MEAGNWWIHRNWDTFGFDLFGISSIWYSAARNWTYQTIIVFNNQTKKRHGFQTLNFQSEKVKDIKQTPIISVVFLLGVSRLRKRQFIPQRQKIVKVQSGHVDWPTTLLRGCLCVECFFWLVWSEWDWKKFGFWGFFLELVWKLCFEVIILSLHGIWASDKIRHDQSSIERVVGLPLLRNR